MANTKILAEERVSTVRKAGTDWPCVNQLVRDQRPGQRPTWQIVRRLCNGVPEGGVSAFRTEHEARAAWDRELASMADTSGT